MKHFKQASLAALMTLLLSLWLFGFQLQAEGVGLTVVNRLDGNGPALLLGVALKYHLGRSHLNVSHKKLRINVSQNTTAMHLYRGVLIL